MKIWTYYSDSAAYEMFLLEERNREFIKSFDGTKKTDTWIPVKLKRGFGQKKFSNTPSFHVGIPIFDDRAAERLHDLIVPNVEILPVDFNYTRKFYVINITKIIDCVDYNNVEYESFPDGRVMYFTKYSFILDKVKNEHIFKIPEFPRGEFFVSDEFKRRVEDTRMKGFCFELVWDSEAE